ncbi:hypothetical protein BFAG_01924 [Bacteroides fragilis 3_1_12]|uniref:Uncharacterized protein n=1 Tax=Bacteroides fragilis 3_1_12 TaxID=457424 RepID=A0ABN0BK01_BACFG|nr:hypothetical protein BFAG_01924 [Bacteroides fragilis 3_1_12]
MGDALHHPDRAENKRTLSAPYPFFLKYVSLISFTIRCLFVFSSCYIQLSIKANGQIHKIAYRTFRNAN